MKWKIIFSSYKPMPYRKHSVDGNGYMFGFINIEGFFDGETYKKKYQFVKVKHYQNAVNAHMKQFLHKIENDFWLTARDSRFRLCNWNSGPIVTIKGLGYTNPNEEVHIEDAMPIFQTNLHNNSFTDIVALYLDMKSLETQLLKNHTKLIKTLEVAMYQYLWATNWWLRRKVLKILKESLFDIDYRKLESSYIEVERDNWKMGDD